MQRSTLANSVMHYVYVFCSSLLAKKRHISFFLSPVYSTVSAQFMFTGLMSAMWGNFTIKYFGVREVNSTKMKIKRQSFLNNEEGSKDWR